MPTKFMYIDTTTGDYKQSDTLDSGATLKYNAGTTITSQYELVTKGYVDALVTGLEVHSAVAAATTDSLKAFSVSADFLTITSIATEAFGLLDGQTLAWSTTEASASRILVKDEIAVMPSAAVNLSSDWGSANATFSVAINGGTPVVVTLNTLAATRDAMITEINAELATAGGDAAKITAFAIGTDKIGFRAIVGQSVNSFTLTDGTNTPLVTDIKVAAGTYTSSPMNGIYFAKVEGDDDPATSWVLQRTSDFDQTPIAEIHDGDFFFVQEGTVNAHAGFVQTVPWSAGTLGTTNITFTQFSGAGAMNLDSLGDVVITGIPADNEVLAFDTTSGTWINQTASEAGLSASDHNHDLDYADINHNHDLDYAPLSHNHVAADITDFTAAAQDAVGGILPIAGSASNQILFTYVDSDPGPTSINAVINFGTDTNEVDAALLPIDAITGTSATNVQDALVDLFGKTNGIVFTAAGTGIVKGDVVYISADNTVTKYADITVDQNPIGVAAADEAGDLVEVLLPGDVAEAPVNITAGAQYYWTGSTWSTDFSTLMETSGNRIYQIAIGKETTTDTALVQLHYVLTA